MMHIVKKNYAGIPLDILCRILGSPAGVAM